MYQGPSLSLHYLRSSVFNSILSPLFRMSDRYSYANSEEDDRYQAEVQDEDERQYYEDEDAYWLEDHDQPQSKKGSGASDSSQQRPLQATTLSASKAAKKTGVKGPKTFALPIDRASYETMIGEGTTLDDEGYPLLPNGITTFVVREDQKKPANWGSFGFAYTTSGGGTHKGTATWRTVRYSCLGVIVCDTLDCDYRGSPFTSRARRNGWEATWERLFLPFYEYVS